MVQIYKHASGYPATLYCSPLFYYYFVGFDDHGNLFLDGEDISNQFHLCRAKETDTSFTPMTIGHGTIRFPGMVQWYAPGHYLAVGDQECGFQRSTCIYKLSVHGLNAKVVGSTTPFTYKGGPACDIVQGVIGGGRHATLYGGDYEGCKTADTTVDRWAYPNAGFPGAYYDNSAFIEEPIGAAISIKP